MHIKRGEPDVATVSKLSLDELEAGVARAANKGAAAGDASDSKPLEIDIICGGARELGWKCAAFEDNSVSAHAEG